MIFKIHFTKNGVDDEFEISGETVEDIYAATMKEMDRRGLTRQVNNMWSEEVKV
jgi:hypothetical protein